ncbi:MAG: hypothetical protein IK003_06350 [Prevotella sp.]|nr:hypothetical protein [Prevotella sp.]
MNKKVIMLSCFAAVAIATFVGTKTLQSNAYEANGLLAQNVEALSKPEANQRIKCYYSYHYQQGYQIVYCGTCKYVQGTFDFWASQHECDR